SPSSGGRELRPGPPLRSSTESPNASPALPRPQPAERSRGEQRVDQAVERVLHGRAPRPLVPDRVLPQRNGVADEVRGPGEAEHLEVGTTTSRSGHADAAPRQPTLELRRAPT